jgi:Cytochrome c
LRGANDAHFSDSNCAGAGRACPPIPVGLAQHLTWKAIPKTVHRFLWIASRAMAIKAKGAWKTQAPRTEQYRLNSIDATIANQDPKVFAYNIDLFVEHGSTPDGPNPALKMTTWGDTKGLTPQQIADVIAYVMSLNK